MSKMRTEDLIERLAADARPVHCLKSPFRRTAVWLAWSLPWVAAIVFTMGLRPDLAARLSDARWMIEEIAALATGLMAAMAAFCAGVPGRPRWEHFVPLVPLAIWLGALGQGCIQDWMHLGRAGLVLYADWQCLPGIVMIGFGPAVAMAVMILRGSPITPMTTTALGALAAGGLATAALRLFHQEDGSLMVLVWQSGTVFGLTLIAGLLGKTILRWRLPSMP
ncbi:MAG: DUF1109 family protein [Alphaproteobacteria bacterium]|nr:DUF1109 family protein [Alphaproteobacteria bacterium]